MQGGGTAASQGCGEDALLAAPEPAIAGNFSSQRNAAQRGTCSHPAKLLSVIQLSQAALPEVPSRSKPCGESALGRMKSAKSGNVDHA